jgi:hypothetical protein
LQQYPAIWSSTKCELGMCLLNGKMQTDQYNSPLWHTIDQLEENTLGARDRRVKSRAILFTQRNRSSSYSVHYYRNRAQSQEYISDWERERE